MNGYGEQYYGPPPGYPPPAYAPPPAWPVPAPQAWPHGPGRPEQATAAGVLGFVTAGLTIAFSLVFLAVALSGDADVSTWVMLLGLPCAGAVIVGATELLRRRTAQILFGSAVASIVVLVVALVVALIALPTDDLAGRVLFAGCALPLPVLTAIFARVRRVTGWVAATAPVG